MPLNPLDLLELSYWLLLTHQCLLKWSMPSDYEKQQFYDASLKWWGSCFHPLSPGESSCPCLWTKPRELFLANEHKKNTQPMQQAVSWEMPLSVLLAEIFSYSFHSLPVVNTRRKKTTRCKGVKFIGPFRSQDVALQASSGNFSQNSSGSHLGQELIVGVVTLDFSWGKSQVFLVCFQGLPAELCPHYMRISTEVHE